MTFRVEFAQTAAEDVAETYRWLAKQSPEAAERWRLSLLQAVESLTSMPERCSLAPENDWYPGELRQFLHGKRYNTYRVLFEIRSGRVLIVRVRHRAQDLLQPGDIPDDE